MTMTMLQFRWILAAAAVAVAAVVVAAATPGGGGGPLLPVGSTGTAMSSSPTKRLRSDGGEGLRRRRRHPSFRVGGDSPVLFRVRGGAAAAARKPSGRGRNRRASPAAAPPPPRALAAAAKAATKPSSSSGAGTATIPSEVMNLVKSILGAGVVGIPAGIAAWGDERTAVFPAVVLIACMATLAGYGFCLIGTVCYKTDAPSYREAWSRSVGKKSSWIPAMAAALVTTCTVLTCSIILADTLPSIVEALVPTTPSSGGAVDDEIGGGVAAISLPRNAALVLNTVLLTPLCLMQDLSKLAPFSVVGLLGTLYMAAAMCARYFANSYAVGKPLYETLAADSVPRFGAARWKAAFQSSKIAILMSMLSSAFMAHYNASKFLWELRDATLPRFYKMAASSFGISAVFMAIIAAAGFATFGGSCRSMILLNYSPQDVLINFSRFALFLSIFFGFPLAFVGVREQLLDLIGCHGKKRQDVSTPLTLTILAAVTALAWNLRDIRVILALGGSTWGNCVIYIFPSIMLLHAAQTHKDLQMHVPFAKATMALGFGLGVIGTKRAVSTFLLGNKN